MRIYIIYRVGTIGQPLLLRKIRAQGAAEQRILRTYFQSPDACASPKVQDALRFFRDGGQVRLPLQTHFHRLEHDITSVFLFLMGHDQIAALGRRRWEYLIMGVEASCVTQLARFYRLIHTNTYSLPYRHDTVDCSRLYSR